MLIVNHTKQKGRHDLVTASSVAAKSKELTYLVGASASKPSPCSPEQAEDHRHEVKRCDLVSA